VAGPCSKTVSVIYLPRCCKNSVWRSVKIPCLVGDIKGQHGETGRRRKEQSIGGTFTLTQLVAGRRHHLDEQRTPPRRPIHNPTPIEVHVRHTRSGRTVYDNPNSTHDTRYVVGGPIDRDLSKN
jgi:hypothetical protein